MNNDMDTITRISESNQKNIDEIVQNEKIKCNQQNNFEKKFCPWIIQHLRNSTNDTVEDNFADSNNESNEISTSNNSKSKRKMSGSCYVKNGLRTSDIKPYKDASFNNFNINANILLALDENGWEWPSPIQEECFKNIFLKKDIIARSKNGTGKTGAYTIGILNNIDIHKGIQAVILVPTRELALQIANVCISLSKYVKDIKIMVTTGGTDLTEDLIRLSQSINILVGTPGRFLDLLSHDEKIFSEIEIFVLDEADKLLSCDFKFIIEEIINLLPKNCQKLLFSATYPINVKSFIDKYLNECEYCNVMNELVLKGVSQYYAYLKENQKTSCLKMLMKELEIFQAIIFCNSAKRVELLSKYITEAGHSSYYIHSKMDQEARNRVFHDFRWGYVTFLVCTDVISRGIDISTVNVVFNFDFPRFSESYLHRIGRCGRFGHLGIAINFITDDDKDRVKQIEKELDTRIYPIPRRIDRRVYVSTYQTKSEFDDIGEMYKA